MKRFYSFIAVISLCTCMIGTAAAQNNGVFSQGTVNINVGLGLPTYFHDIAVPPLSLSVDVGVYDFGRNIGTIGVGGYFGFCHHNDHHHTYYYYGNFSDFLVGPRVSYHFSGIPNVSNLDLYANILLGANFRIAEYNDYNYTYFGYDFKVGAKYWFNNYVGVWGEIGYSALSFLEAGVSFKF